MDKEYWREYDRRRREEALPAYHALMSCYPLSLESLDGEEWKDIAGYNGDYQVSNFGRIKSFKWTKPRIRKPALFGEYLGVNLSGGNKIKQRTIHVLVAEAFIPNPDNKPQVNHRIGMKFNCHVSNLEWATGSENMQHAVKNGLSKSGVDRSDSKIKNEADIIYIRDNPDHLSQDELAAMFGVDKTAISLIQLGKSYPNEGGTIRKAQKQSPRVPDEIRAQIRADYATGKYSQRALARKYGVSHTTICRIIKS